jgi:3-hydroxyisobutyrate dehydrogenase
VKLINNMIGLCSVQLVQEGLVLGVKAGLDPAALHQMLSVGSSRPYLGALPAMIGRRFENPSFALGLAAKDVGLCLEAARELAVAMPVASAAHQTYLRAMAAGLGGESHMATLKTLESGANVEVPKQEVTPVPPPSRQ